MARLANSTPKRTRLRLVDVYPRGTLGSGKEPLIGAGGDVPLVVAIPTSKQTVAALQVLSQPVGAAATQLWAIGPTGGVQLGPASILYQSYRAQTTLSAAQLEAINTTPISLAAAPGSGFALRFDRMTCELVFATTAFTTAYALIPVYHGATTSLATGTLTPTQGQSGSSIMVDLGGPVAAGITLTANVGIDAYSATNWSNSGSPDSSVIVTLDYTVIQLT